MPGGILQLNNYGAEDILLTGNPQMTFFKTLYKRHSNFAIETKEQIFSGGVNFGKKNCCKIN